MSVPSTIDSSRCRATHGASPALERAVWFDELRPFLIDGLPSKMEVFLRVAREMGIDV